MDSYFKGVYYQNIVIQKLLQCVLLSNGVTKENLKNILEGVTEEAEEEIKKFEKEIENGN